MESKPLLSICIPTYNRATYLEKCLESIVQQEGFDDRVEIVISDNCSTDDTQKIGEIYSERYSNVKYFRNEENVLDKNFTLVFQRANGVLRKLTNDTILYYSGAIQYMIDAVNAYRETKPQLYFHNSANQKEDMILADTLEKYILSLGYWITWIGSISVWEDDCDDLKTLIENAHTKLGQVPYLLENYEKRGKAIILNRVIMESQSVGKKDLSYGIFTVFYDNFLGFIRRYVDNGDLLEDTYEGLRKNLLLDFFSEWVVNKRLYAENFIFSDEDLEELIYEAYRKESYYKYYRFILFIRMFKETIKKMIKKAMRK